MTSRVVYDQPPVQPRNATSSVADLIGNQSAIRAVPTSLPTTCATMDASLAAQPTFALSAIARFVRQNAAWRHVVHLLEYT